MALLKKERFVRPLLSVPIRVQTDSEGNPLTLVYKDILWKSEKNLTVLGQSKSTDLLSKGERPSYRAVSAQQYILCDEQANMYEGLIVVYKEPAGYSAQLTGLKTSPE